MELLDVSEWNGVVEGSFAHSNVHVATVDSPQVVL